MKTTTYLKEKSGWIIGFFLVLALTVILGKIFACSMFFLFAILFLQFFFFLSYFICEFIQKKSFYDRVQQNLAGLNPKYLITELMERPDFLEGSIFHDTLYEIDKSMNEHIAVKDRQIYEFKDYVELWIHQIKLPIAAISLMHYNGDTVPHHMQKQMSRITHDVEQILFYVRADSAEKDFLMKKCTLEDMVNASVKDYKNELILCHFEIRKSHLNRNVITDSKWCIFIIGQLISNSIKYQSSGHNTLIFSAVESDKTVILSIQDTGIGICSKDLPRVFDKSFTGENGRKISSSTGMGLYICQKLCHKLGHHLHVESVEGRGTTISIVFGLENYHLTNL